MKLMVVNLSPFGLYVMFHTFDTHLSKPSIARKVGDSFIPTTV